MAISKPVPLSRLLTFISMFSALPVMQAAAQQNSGPLNQGQAMLKVSVVEQKMQIDFQSRLDNLLDVEFTADSDQQKQLFNSLISRFQQARLLFITPVAAHCRVESMQINAPIELDSDQPGGGPQGLSSAIVFRCSQPEELNYLDVQLFKAFPKLDKLDASLFTVNGQISQELSPQANRINW